MTATTRDTQGPVERLSCDVLVIGGGPAGSTVSALLASRGIDTLVLEKDRHPRFHIGESLLPRNMDLLRRLGLEEEIRRIGVLKRGADFTCPGDDRHVVYDFSEALAPDEPTAFQVRRAEYDEILIRNAERSGARVFEETRMTAFELGEAGVSATARGPEGTDYEIDAAYLIDASGRDSVLSRKLDLRRRDPNHASAAVFGHFDGVRPRPGEEAGNISVYWFDAGWFWVIPLQAGCTSVGMVCHPDYLKGREGDLESLFRRTVETVPDLSARMSGAEARTALQGTGNFSYRSERMTGPRYFLVGDANAFIDPVFSSGVYLAMQGAEYAAEAVAACLADPAGAVRYRRRYERRVRRGLSTFSWFIYRFRSPAFRFLFTHPSDRFAIRATVISVLSGDVFGRVRLWPGLWLFKALYWGASAVLRLRGEGARPVS